MLWRMWKQGKSIMLLEELYQISWILNIIYLRYSIILNTTPKIIVITANTIILSLVIYTFWKIFFRFIRERLLAYISFFCSIKNKKIRENKLINIFLKTFTIPVWVFESLLIQSFYVHIFPWDGDKTSLLSPLWKSIPSNLWT